MRRVRKGENKEELHIIPAFEAEGGKSASEGRQNSRSATGA